MKDEWTDREIDRLGEVNKGLLEACREIAKGEGAFNHDQLIHAENTIESMKELARAAIEAAERGKP